MEEQQSTVAMHMEIDGQSDETAPRFIQFGSLVWNLEDHHLALSNKRTRKSSLPHPQNANEQTNEEHEGLQHALAASMGSIKETSGTISKDKGEIITDKEEETSLPEKPTYPLLPEEPKVDKSRICRVGVGAITDQDSRNDKKIFVRVRGVKKIYWYVIEEKDVDDGNTMIGCDSDNDRVRRLDFLCSNEPFMYSNNLVIINSTLYLVDGEVTGEHVGYWFLDLHLGEGAEWRDGGSLMDYQRSRAAVGLDGYIYAVGDYVLYRFSTCGTVHEQLFTPARITNRKEMRLLGLSKKQLFVCTVGAGANRISSFDLKSAKWMILDVGYFLGDWSAGVVLYEDRYLFSFGTHNPTRQEDVFAPGVYVFDTEKQKWLSEPVQGLPTDGKVLPLIFIPEPHHEFVDIGYSAFLLQIGKQDEHKLALLWDGPGINPESRKPRLELVWSKFVLNRSTTTTADQDPHFYASSVSSGHCSLDDFTYDVINCAAGM